MKKIIVLGVAIVASFGTLFAMEKTGAKRTREGELVKDNPSKEGASSLKRRVKIRLRNPQPSLSHNMPFDGSPDDIEFYARYPEVLTPDDGNWSLLHAVAKAGNSEQLKILLDADACLEVTDKEGCTPLHIAAGNGNDACVEALIQQGASKDIKNTSGYAPLHYAAVMGHVDCIKLLCKAGACKDVKAPNGMRPLHIAVANGKVASVNALIQKGAKRDALEKDKRTALHVAVLKNKPGCVKALLEWEMNKDLQDANRESALHMAAKNGYVEIVQLLIDAGADQRVKDSYGERALHLAAKSKHLGCLKLLVPKTKPLLNSKSNNGKSALHLAADGFYEGVKILLEAGADVDNMSTVGMAGSTPLHDAIAGDHVECVKLLLSRGADPKKKDGCGRTAIALAATYNKGACLKEILEHRPAMEQKERAEFLKQAVLRNSLDVLDAFYEHQKKDAKIVYKDAFLLADGTKAVVPEQFFTISKRLAGQSSFSKLPYVTPAMWDLFCEKIDKVCHFFQRIETIKTSVNSTEIEDTDFYARRIDELKKQYNEYTIEQLSHLLYVSKSLKIPFLEKILTSLLTEKGARNGCSLPCGPLINHKKNIRYYAHHSSALEGYSNVLDYLKEKDINVANQHGWTLLHKLAKDGDYDSMKILLEAKANTEVYDKADCTPLHIAVAYRKVACVQLLLDRGANIEARTNKKQTPLFQAVLCGYAECVELLLKRGADKNAVDEHGRTPLLCAAFEGRADCVTLLLRSGARRNGKELAAAIKSDSIDCVKELLSNENNQMLPPGQKKERILKLAVKNGSWNIAASLWDPKKVNKDDEYGFLLVEDELVLVCDQFFSVSETLKDVATVVKSKIDIPLSCSKATWQLLSPQLNKLCAKALLVRYLKETGGERFNESNHYRELKKEFIECYSSYTKEEAAQLLHLSNYLNIPFFIDVFADVYAQLDCTSHFAEVTERIHKDYRWAVLKAMSLYYYKQAQELNPRRKNRND